jgi:hypothetical protein
MMVVMHLGRRDRRRRVIINLHWAGGESMAVFGRSILAAIPRRGLFRRRQAYLYSEKGI